MNTKNNNVNDSVWATRRTTGRRTRSGTRSSNTNLSEIKDYFYELISRKADLIYSANTLSHIKNYNEIFKAIWIF